MVTSTSYLYFEESVEMEENKKLDDQEVEEVKALKPKMTKGQKGLIGVLIALVLILIGIIVWLYLELNKPVEEESSIIVEESSESSVVEESSEIIEEPQMLPYMAALYAKNPDIIGWITIEGTQIDYPLMFTPDDEEKYIDTNFDGEEDKRGEIFLDKDCDIDPESDNLIFYGHNMETGEMFGELLGYEKEEFWKEHPLVKVKTLYEERTYEVIGAFRDHVYYNYEDCFKFYQFIDYEKQEELDEAVNYYIDNTPYDMEVEYEMDDRFITLVTCAYHEEDGRYVVVARDITERPEANSQKAE